MEILRKPTEIEIPTIGNKLGFIGVMEGSDFLPFTIKRLYFIKEIPELASRGSHAHKTLSQVIMAISGGFNLLLDDGENTYKFELENATSAVLVPPGLWRTLDNFSNDATCLVLASHEYDEADYIRDYEDFLKWTATRERTIL